jgi:hypothetical protein
MSPGDLFWVPAKAEIRSRLAWRADGQVSTVPALDERDPGAFQGAIAAEGPPWARRSCKGGSRRDLRASGDVWGACTGFG